MRGEDRQVGLGCSELSWGPRVMPCGTRGTRCGSLRTRTPACGFKEDARGDVSLRRRPTKARGVGSTMRQVATVYWVSVAACLPLQGCGELPYYFLWPSRAEPVGQVWLGLVASNLVTVIFLFHVHYSMLMVIVLMGNIPCLCGGCLRKF